MEREIRYCMTEDGVRIGYWSVGSGPLLLRLASPPFDLGGPEIYGQVGQQWTIAGFDWRGIGLSQRELTAGVSLETMRLDLKAAVDALGADRQVALDGVAFGGFSAVQYAVEERERVSHLILTDAFASGPAFFATPRSRSFEALSTDWDAFTEITAAASWGEGRAATREQARALRELVSNDIAMAYFGAFRRADVRGILASVRAPTLVVQHADSGNTAIAMSQELAAGVPDGRLTMIPGVQGEGMAQLAEAIAGFLGVTAAAASPTGSGVRTVLFTDLVGHTEMMQQLGDTRGRDLLREHERITRETLRQHGGDEVKTMGDGFLASFGSVTKAMECAIALQRALAYWNDATVAAERSAQPGRGAPAVKIRVGLNAGEPIEEDGDLFGSTVILASRVCDQAEAGEILIPEPVRHLLSGKGFIFADRGQFLPKGFEDAVRLFEVRWHD